MVISITCPVGHKKVWKKGTTPTRHGPRVRYVCTVCGRTFYGPKPKSKGKSKSK